MITEVGTMAKLVDAVDVSAFYGSFKAIDSITMTTVLAALADTGFDDATVIIPRHDPEHLAEVPAIERRHVDRCHAAAWERRRVGFPTVQPRAGATRACPRAAHR